MSLGTADRYKARNRGAALTAAYGQVAEMLKAQDRARQYITKRESQSAAKAMDEEQLAELCPEQRAACGDDEFNSVANRAFVDYLQRPTNLGGHMSLLHSKKTALQAQDGRHIDDLRRSLDKREVRGISSIRGDDVDRQFCAKGMEPSTR